MTETETAFISRMEKLLEEDPGTLSSTTTIANLSAWDSLTFVAFLAMADSEYGTSVEPKQVRESKTLGDLMKLVVKS